MIKKCGVFLCPTVLFAYIVRTPSPSQVVWALALKDMSTHKEGQSVIKKLAAHICTSLMGSLTTSQREGRERGSGPPPSHTRRAVPMFHQLRNMSCDWYRKAQGLRKPFFVSSRTSCSRQRTSCPELMDKSKHGNFCSICEFLGPFCQWASLIPAGCNSCRLVPQIAGCCS